MNNNLLSSLWLDLSTDLGNPGLRWQLAALVVSVGLGWLLARMVRNVVAARAEERRNAGGTTRLHLAAETAGRILWPLLTLLLLIVSSGILQRWYSVDLLRLAAPLFGSFALIRMAFHLLHRVFARGGRVGGMVVLFERSFATLVWCVVALHITGLLPELVHVLESSYVPLGRNRVSLLTVLQAIVSVSVTMLLALWASALLEERLMKLDSMHSSMRAVLSRMGKGLLILLALLFSLSMVGIDLTVLSVFSGALGVGLGLGLQKLASSYVSGFVILLERSLSIGDAVTVDKFSGKVAQINTRYTVLRGGDGTDTVLPNDMLVSAAVQNMTLTDHVVQATTRIVIDYRSDAEVALRLMEEAAHSVERVRKGPDRLPGATMLSFMIDGIELQLAFFVNSPDHRGGALSEVNRAIWQSFQANGIQVPAARREIRLTEEQYIGFRDHINAQQSFPNKDLQP